MGILAVQVRDGRLGSKGAFSACPSLVINKTEPIPCLLRGQEPRKALCELRATPPGWISLAVKRGLGNTCSSLSLLVAGAS